MPEINDWEEVPIDDWVEVKPTAAPQQSPGFLSRVGTDLGKRVSGVGAALLGSDQNPAYPATIPERLLRAGGQVAGGIMDIPTEAAKSAYSTLVPESAQQAISGAVKPVIQDLAQSPVIQYLLQKAKDNPNLVKDVEALMNIGGAVPLVKGGASLVKGVAPLMKDAAAIGKEAIMGKPDIPTITKKLVEVGTRKGIKPTNLGRNPTVTKKFYDDVSLGSQNIVKNKGLITLNGETGKVPKNLGETLDAIEQSKKINLDEFLGMQAQAGEGGALVKPQGLVDELVQMANAEKGEALHVAKFAQSELPAYATLTDDGHWIAKSFTPQEAQANVAQLNNTLKGYFKNPSFESLSNTGVKLTIRDQMANALNDTVESMVGPGHQEFKNTWGALKNMEGQVTHRFNIDTRKASGGFFDLTTPFTAAKVIAGLAGKDPISLASAAGMWGAKKYLKAMNEPNRYIKGMFEGLDKVQGQGLRNSPFFADRSLWSVPPEPTGIPMTNFSGLRMESGPRVQQLIEGIPIPGTGGGSGLMMESENDLLQKMKEAGTKTGMPLLTPKFVGDKSVPPARGPLSQILTQVSNHGRSGNLFDKKIDWTKTGGSK